MTVITTVSIPPFALYEGDLGNNGTGVGTANTAYLVAVKLSVPFTLSALRCRFGAGGAGHYDVGMYDATGTNDGPNNLLAHAAATATSLVTATGVQTPTLIAGTQALVSGTLPLQAGKYWLALWIDNATDTMNRETGSNNLVVVQSGTTTGPLPLAASSLTGLANAALKPLIIGLRSGGWS